MSAQFNYALFNSSVDIIHNDEDLEHALISVNPNVETSGDCLYALKRIIDEHSKTHAILSFNFFSTLSCDKLINLYDNLVENYTSIVFINDEDEDEEANMEKHYTIFIL